MYEKSNCFQVPCQSLPSHTVDSDGLKTSEASEVGIPLLRCLSTNSAMQAEKLETWSTVLDTMTQFDEKMVNDWRDDLQNLLIFVSILTPVSSRRSSD